MGYSTSNEPDYDESDFSEPAPTAGPQLQVVKNRFVEAAKNRPLRTVHDILVEAYSQPAPERVSTGIADLDVILGGGLIIGNVTLICAPPGSGKTGLGIFFSRKMADAGWPVLIAQMELSDEEVAARVASQTTRTPVRSILEDRDEAAIATALAATKGKNIFSLGERPGLVEIEAKLCELIAQFGKVALLLDFLQQTPASGAGVFDARSGVGKVAYDLKALAEKHKCPCVVISSVSRANYKPVQSKDPRAWLAVAKESGDVEFAAGVLTFLEVGEFDRVSGEYPGRLIVAKNRHGETGFVGLRFHGASGAWRSDPTALGEFGNVARNLKNGAREHGKAVRKDADDDTRFLETLRRVGQVQRSSFAKARGDQRPGILEQWGMSPEAAVESFDRLVGEGRIVVGDVVAETPAGRRTVRVARAVGS